MHCGYLFYLIVVLWAELAAGRVIPTTNPAVSDRLNTIKNLQKALCEYDSALHKAEIVTTFPMSEKVTLVQNCTESPAQLTQSSEVATQLLKHQKCAQQLQAEASEAFCNVFILNRDVLLHLGSDSGADCPSPPTRPSDLYTAIRETFQCVQCWKEQLHTLLR
ncbi:uncharacterized protein AB9X84_022945 [Acanthopagrus schlegelii]